tara:strand:- start:15593 stop:17119 length:1527 start_codon:yes stop_codon:yes gene_type:complete
MGEETRETNTWRLQPLTEIYLRSIPDFGIQRAAENFEDIRDIYLFSSIATLILGIACANYVNLTTARALNRAREVGLRKTIGANRTQLVSQSLGEASVVSFLASVLALGLVVLALPRVNTLTGKTLSPSNEPLAVAVLTLVSFLGGLTAGSYPAFVLSRFDAARVLRGSGELGGAILRKGLVAAQFTITVGLIALTLVVHTQMDFIRSRDPVFDRSFLVTIPIFEVNRRLEGRLANSLVDRYKEVKHSFLTHPNVVKATAHRRTPGRHGTGLQRIIMPETEPDTEYPMEIQNLDDSYLDTYGIELKAGKDFTSLDTPRGKVIVNEATLRQLGWTLEESVGRRIVWRRGATFRSPIEIVGVMADFNRASVREPVRPMAISFAPWLYTMVTGFSVLSIFVACLGLFGLAAFTAQQRTQEIGIRKVLGATVSGIVLLVSRSFLTLVLISCAIGLPLAWVTARSWLDDFVYRTELSPFIFSALLAVCVAFVAVISQAFRAACVDPIRALHHE